MNAGWQIKTLNQIATNLDNRRVPITKGVRTAGEYPYYGASGIVDYVADYIFDEDTLLISEDGANLLARSTPIAFSASGKYWVNNHAHILKFEHLTTQRFVELFFESIPLDQYVTGAAQPKLNQKSLNSIPVPIPPISEQEKIVGILDEAFESIATAKANAEKNLQNARALFESHLNAVLSQSGDGWKQAPLETLCNIKHGFAFKSEFFTDSGDYVLLTPGNFYETGGYRDRGDKQKFYVGEIPNGFVLSCGDLLVAMTEQAAGLLGSPIIVPASGKFLHNQRLGLVTKKQDAPWSNEFFFHVFNKHSFRQAVHDSGTGVKVRHTSPTKLGEVEVSFPVSVSEQLAIVETLNELNQETQRLESIYLKKLAALDQLKKSLLHQAFTGQLTPQQSVIVPSTRPNTFPTTISNISTTDLHCGILGLAYQLHEKRGVLNLFGHVKGEKVAHLIEAFVGIDLGRNPIKDKFGPNDFPHLKNKVEPRARKAGYFDFKQDSNLGPYKVTKFRQFDNLIVKTQAALGDRLQDVENLLELTLNMDKEAVEVFCTVFAGWNNLLLDQVHPTDEEIVFESRENWHPSKLKIKRVKFFESIEWMRRNKTIPLGRGKKVLSKAK